MSLATAFILNMKVMADSNRMRDNDSNDPDYNHRDVPHPLFGVRNTPNIAASSPRRGRGRAYDFPYPGGEEVEACGTPQSGGEEVCDLFLSNVQCFPPTSRC